MKPASACASQDEVRSQIDRVDAAIVDLLGERWTYIDRMWALKRAQGAAGASVPWRNREVIERVRGRAVEKGFPPEMAEALWRLIIGWGIQYQDEKLRDDLEGPPQAPT
ncbi:MAG: chorismate mutase [Parvularculaceae bacterium]|nr:chorismate mutase [Parvularculaceae bacterium]